MVSRLLTKWKTLPESCQESIKRDGLLILIAFLGFVVCVIKILTD